MDREQEIEALVKIDKTSLKLQRQGLDREALDCMQLGLLKRKNIFGPKSQELASACKYVGETLNKIALKKANGCNYDDALVYLKQALKLLQNDDVGKHETYLNFAAIYLKKGKAKVSLHYLRQVLGVQSQSCISDEKRAKVHLNICAILSQLGKHESALRHAKIAITILEKSVKDFEAKSEKSRSIDTGSRRMVLDMESIDENGSGLYSCEEHLFSDVDSKIIEILAASYYNAGVEFEHLGDIQRSYHKYQQGSRIAASLGCQHDITKTLNESSEALVGKIVKNGIIQDIQSFDGRVQRIVS